MSLLGFWAGFGPDEARVPGLLPGRRKPDRLYKFKPSPIWRSSVNLWHSKINDKANEKRHAHAVNLIFTIFEE